MSNRGTILALLAACMATSATAEPSCPVPPAELPPALVAAQVLKTDMMVAALTCHLQGRYNTAVLRFRPIMAGHDRALLGWFQEAFGTDPGTERHDAYITDLANGRSQQARSMIGNCAQATRLFSGVLALRGQAQLDSYATKNLAEHPLVACPVKAAENAPGGP